MTEMRVRLQGSEELLNKLREMGIRVQDVLEPAVQAAAELVRDAARPAAPGPFVETETTERTAKRVEVSVGPDRGHWYYRFFETGTSGHGPARRRFMVWPGGDGVIVARFVAGVGAAPFLRPAIDGNEAAAQQAMGNRWRGAVESLTE